MRETYANLGPRQNILLICTLINDEHDGIFCVLMELLNSKRIKSQTKQSEKEESIRNSFHLTMVA